MAAIAPLPSNLDLPCVPFSFSSWSADSHIDTIEEASTSGAIKTVEDTIARFKEDPLSDKRVTRFTHALTLAIEGGHYGIVDLLLSENVPLSKSSILGAIYAKSTRILLACIGRRFRRWDGELVPWSLNEPMGRDDPPVLGFALFDSQLAEWLLDHGADPNARCELDRTPLSFAGISAPISVIELLFRYSGDVTKGELLDHAVERRETDIEVLEFLIRTGAPVNEIKYTTDPKSYHERLPFGLGTPLHKAATLHKFEAMQFLLKNGAQSTLLDTKGMTALDIARRRNYGDIVGLLEANDVSSGNAENGNPGNGDAEKGNGEIGRAAQSKL